MKSLLRNFLINLLALWLTSQILPGLTVSGGLMTILISAGALMLINLIVIPLLKVMFLPLNLLTLGIFTWVVNVIGLYFLTTIVPQIKLYPYTFPGANINGIILPQYDFNVLYVAILVSFLIGLISHFLHWLSK